KTSLIVQAFVEDFMDEKQRVLDMDELMTKVAKSESEYHEMIAQIDRFAEQEYEEAVAQDEESKVVLPYLQEAQKELGYN
ncbi:MAG: hypothetical protein IKF68_05765, partial [Erysipelotrichaceae bacterium]|nr:hypothetical protein [Erysipelotrichaceae bacterium]